jgi:hypothetical protein
MQTYAGHVVTLRRLWFLSVRNKLKPGEPDVKEKLALRSARGRGLRNPRPARGYPAIEELETRALLSTASLIADPNVIVMPAATTSSSVSGYSPQQIRQAYTFAGLTLSASGGDVSADGSGETIAIVDAYNDKTISSDLAAFDSHFGLATANLNVVNQTGGSTLTNATDSGWAAETSLDVEWAHAIAPGAKIVLVEANSDSLSDLLAAVKTAAGYSGVSVVSMSWGSSEFSGETSDDSYFTAPSGHTNVTFVAATGDNGTGAEWPASSPDVIAVGGTTLNITSSSNYSGETAWSDGGGGVSRYESATSAQESVTGSRSRETPDVSYDANPSTGYAIYDDGSWEEVGGTSAGAPQWAALIAIADQGRVAAGETTLSTAQADAALYQAPSSDFHDVTSGSNGDRAGKGYDLATGIGTPIANNLIPYLVKYTPSTNTSSGGSTGSSSGGGVSGEGGGGASGGGGSRLPPPPSRWWGPFRSGPGFFAGRAMVVSDPAGAATSAALMQSLAASTAGTGRSDLTFSLLGEGRLDLPAGQATTVSVGSETVSTPLLTAQEATDATAAPVFDGLRYHVARSDDREQADTLANDDPAVEGVAVTDASDGDDEVEDSDSV